MTIAGRRGGGGEGRAKIDMVGVPAQMKSTQFTGRTQKRLPGKGRHHRFNGHEFGKAPGHGEGQGRLVCRSPWGHKKSGMTWRLNNKKSSSQTAKREQERWQTKDGICHGFVLLGRSEEDVARWSTLGSVFL